MVAADGGSEEKGLQRVYGIPLHVWDEPFFKLLGSMFGTFQDFDEETVMANRLDYARILVSSPRMNLIEGQIQISVVGTSYLLWAVEGGRREDAIREWEKEASVASTCDAVVRGIPAVVGDVFGSSSDEKEKSFRFNSSVHLAAIGGKSSSRSNAVGLGEKGDKDQSLVGLLIAVPFVGKVNSNQPLEEIQRIERNLGN